ncbi:hypothetical protein DPMN_003473 [Dreissena polymorpha]|uniref:Uncharacterized protein n=1 Tax=Dreissena polymorpha TaxID=45954 RepID=A0A9D4RUS2_DREPO|nr:hypothetical protein DPMN_003473 [Dreissena polymorpha]
MEASSSVAVPTMVYRAKQPDTTSKVKVTLRKTPIEFGFDSSKFFMPRRRLLSILVLILQSPGVLHPTVFLAAGGAIKEKPC